MDNGWDFLDRRGCMLYRLDRLRGEGGNQSLSLVHVLDRNDDTDWTVGVGSTYQARNYDSEKDFTAAHYKVMKEREELYRRAESIYADENTELDEHEAEEESDDSDRSLSDCPQSKTKLRPHRTNHRFSSAGS